MVCKTPKWIIKLHAESISNKYIYINRVSFLPDRLNFRTPLFKQTPTDWFITTIVGDSKQALKFVKNRGFSKAC